MVRRSATLYLDLDGSLLDVSKRDYSLYRKIVSPTGCTPLSERRYWLLRRRKTPVGAILRASRARISTRTYQRQWRHLIETPWAMRHNRVIPGARAFLRRWHGSHRLVVVTLRRRQDLLRKELQQRGFSHYLSNCLRGSGDGVPWRIKRTLIAQDLNRHPGPAVLIGDTEVDVRAGASLKLVTIALTHGARDRTQLSRFNPTVILSGFPQTSKWLRRWNDAHAPHELKIGLHPSRP